VSLRATAEADRATGVTATAPWRVRTLAALPGYRLAVMFHDRVYGIADLSGLTSANDLGVFAPLRGQAYCSQAYLELGAVTWPNRADLGAAWMHDQIAKEKTWSVPEAGLGLGRPLLGRSPQLALTPSGSATSKGCASMTADGPGRSASRSMKSAGLRRQPRWPWDVAGPRAASQSVTLARRPPQPGARGWVGV
jgi:hypothetical protein